MIVRQVGAREANQQFSALLAAVESDGETIVITRRGKPVARLIRETAEAASDSNWLQPLVDRLARPMGGEPFCRDDLYDRGDTK